ncbi:Uncharacterised protein [Vibrio cholerae]|nr:Uncharacterised protein [Vibrio cholerae]
MPVNQVAALRWLRMKFGLWRVVPKIQPVKSPRLLKNCKSWPNKPKMRLNVLARVSISVWNKVTTLSL